MIDSNDKDDPRGEQVSNSNREKEIRAIVDDCLVRRANGEEVVDEEIIARHSSLMPELADHLRFLRLVQSAAHQSSKTSSGLRLRCPVCQAPNLLSLDSDLSHFECSACGNPFRLADEEGDAGIYPARMLGHFRLLEKIGGGAFGSVWKAEDTKLDRIVAIKLPLNTRLCELSVSRFVREAQLAARMRHPNIVAVHEVGFEDDLVFIVSDLISGVDLRQWLTENRPTQVEAIQICMTVANALAYAHSQGIIHRDVKPSNILIDGQGTVFITDFGLAKGETSELTLTLEGKVLGTPDYMPPEQVRGLASASDPRADVYSLGVVLFEMLTGERPFRGDTRMVLHQALTCDPPSLRRLNPDVHRDLDTICLKCLEKDPRQRYLSATELYEELDRYSRGMPILARPLGPVGRAWRWGCRNKRVASLGLGLVTSLIAITIISTVAALNIRYHQQEALREASVLALDRGLSFCEKGEVATGLLWIARSLELSGDRDMNLSRVARANLAGWSHLLSPMMVRLSQSKPVTCVAFSSNGQRFVCGSEDGSIRLGTFPARVTGSESGDGESRPSVLSVLHGGPVTAVAFSPDGRFLATGSEDGIVLIWNSETGQQMLQPIQHAERIASLEFSSNGKQLLSGCKDTFA